MLGPYGKIYERPYGKFMSLPQGELMNCPYKKYSIFLVLKHRVCYILYITIIFGRHYV
jgi:hypothetical protein